MKEIKKVKWFVALTEFFGWILIMLSPTLIGLIFGGLFYLYYPGSLGKIGGVIIGTIGLIIGIIWATRVINKYGTIWFISRVTATPEFDIKNELTK